MSASAGIWFVHFVNAEGSPGKRVERLAAPSILAWFQAMIEEARVAVDPLAVSSKALGGAVAGLSSLFAAAKERSLHTPKTVAAISKLLVEHAQVVGPESVRHDAHSVRVFVGGAEGRLGYAFFDDEALSGDALAAMTDPAVSAPEAGVDPFAQKPKARAPKAPGEKAPRASRAKADKGAKTEGGTPKDERAWKAAVAGRTAAEARAYRPSDVFEEGSLVDHVKFGLGVVTRTRPTKVDVLFHDGPKVMVHGATA